MQFFITCFIIYVFYAFYAIFLFLVTCCSLKKNSKFKYIFIIKILLSLDWFSAYLGKFFLEKTCPETLEFKEKKLEFIKNKNNTNLFISILIIVIAFLGKTILPIPIIIILVTYRCISRSFEIIFAFTIDILEEKKSSNLKNKDRLILAIKSYIEVIFNNTVLYHLINLNLIVFWKNYLFGDLLPDDKVLSLGESFYHSIKTSMSFGAEGPFSAIQSITAFVLIVFAIASYLSNDKYE